MDHRDRTLAERVSKLEVGFDTLVREQQATIVELLRKVAILEAYVDAEDALVAAELAFHLSETSEDQAAHLADVQPLRAALHRANQTRDAIDWKPRP